MQTMAKKQKTICADYSGEHCPQECRWAAATREHIINRRPAAVTDIYAPCDGKMPVHYGGTGECRMGADTACPSCGVRYFDSDYAHIIGVPDNLMCPVCGRIKIGGAQA